MNVQKIIIPVIGISAILLAYRFVGWAGVAAVVTGLVMWVLLWFNQMMQVLKRAADRPIGYIDSAVMLNAKLKPRMTLMHVLAMTRSLGKALTEENVQPELFRWTDNGGSHVTCTFVDGKLKHHELFRPAEPDSGLVADAPPPAP